MGQSISPPHLQRKRCTLKTPVHNWQSLQVVLAGFVFGHGICSKSSVGTHIFCMGGAGSSRFTNGVPGHLASAVPSYCTLLFFMTIVAPWEQANNAAMFAEVLCPFPLPPWHA